MQVISMQYSVIWDVLAQSPNNVYFSKICWKLLQKL